MASANSILGAGGAAAAAAALVPHSDAPSVGSLLGSQVANSLMGNHGGSNNNSGPLLSPGGMAGGNGGAGGGGGGIGTLGSLGSQSGLGLPDVPVDDLRSSSIATLRQKAQEHAARLGLNTINNNLVALHQTAEVLHHHHHHHHLGHF